MLKVLGILISGIIVLLIERKNTKSKWNKKEKRTFFISLILGLSLTIIWSLGFNLWNPLDFFLKIYQPIAEPYISYLKQLKN